MIEDKIICKKSDLTSVADTIRSKLGVTDTYYVSELSSVISDELTKKLPTLSNPGTASDLLSGKELIDQDGNKVTGAFTIDTELTAQDNLITSIQTALSNKASVTPVLQNKTVTPSASEQIVTPDSGYDGLSKVTVNGDSNLIAENIAKGASIFGVTGTHSGGASVDTCTVTITTQKKGREEARICYYTCTRFINGTIQSTRDGLNYSTSDAFLSSITLTDVVCGSEIYVSVDGDRNFWDTIDSSGVEIVMESAPFSSAYPMFILKAPTQAGATGSFIASYMY